MLQVGIRGLGGTQRWARKGRRKGAGFSGLAMLQVGIRGLAGGLGVLTTQRRARKGAGFLQGSSIWGVRVSYNKIGIWGLGFGVYAAFDGCPLPCLMT